MRLLIFILFLGVLQSCSNDVVKLYNPNKDKCITIITNLPYRYIISGDYNRVPKSNYVKLDISKIDLEEDQFLGCWEKDGYSWILINDNAIIVENKLDQNTYFFNNRYPKNNKGIPSLIGYHNTTNCFDFGFETLKVRDNEKANVIIWGGPR